jgi:hypothetical protein
MDIALAVVVGVLCLLAFLFLRNDKDGDRPTLSVTIYSASDSALGYIEDGQVKTYEPSLAQMLSDESGGRIRCTNRSINGMELRELLAGGKVQRAVPEATIPSFEEQLKDDPSQLVLIGAGMVDCLVTDVDLLTHMANVRHAVQMAHDAGKIVGLRGFHHLQPNTAVTTLMLARLDQFNQALSQEAPHMGAIFFSTATQGEPEICPDLWHPTLAYHRRIAAHLAAQLVAFADTQQ